MYAMKTNRSIGGQSLQISPLCVLRVSIADLILLKVRTKAGSGRSLPKKLYQRLPKKAMAIMATIPSGSFAVSIPGEIVAGGRRTISINPPELDDGFVITYGRKTNGRYEAEGAQYRNRLFGLREFRSFARQWVEENYGRLEQIPGRYVHFEPAIEEWGVILRDNGYVSRDPSGMPAEATQELRTSGQSKQLSGVLVRIPVFSGDKRQQEEILPLFAQVDVNLNANQGSELDWISYPEYLRIRAERARLPDAIIADFQNWLKLMTEESGFKCWIFRPGMLFGAHSEWWGDASRRRTAHEGVDFAVGLLPSGEFCNIPKGIPVRALAGGKVVAVLEDFLGKTVAVRHEAIARPNGDIFHTLLSHINAQVRPSDSLTGGQIVGTVSKETNSTAPCHLHLTGAWIPEALSDRIRMDLIHPGFEPVALAQFNDQLQDSHLCLLELPENQETHSSENPE